MLHNGQLHDAVEQRLINQPRLPGDVVQVPGPGCVGSNEWLCGTRRASLFLSRLIARNHSALYDATYGPGGVLEGTADQVCVAALGGEVLELQP